MPIIARKLALESALLPKNSTARERHLPEYKSKMENQYQHVENEYFRLKGQLATGRITREQFESALQALLFTDAQGRYWMIGADSGKWFVHDGVRWVEQNPPGSAVAATPMQMPERAPYGPVAAPVQPTLSQPTPSQPAWSPAAPARYAPPPAAHQKSGGCGRTLLVGCLVLLLACALVGGGLYLGVQSGAVTTRTLLTLAGLGPAKIVVNNFRDDPIQVKIVQLDVEQDSFPAQTTMELNPFDVKTFSAGNASRYRATFLGGTADKELGECVLHVRSGDEYQFVALPDGILVNRENNLPTVGRDLMVETSSLCRAQ